MKRLFAVGILMVIATLSLPDDLASGATCTGADPCRACKNCNNCKHCHLEGGKCGVCKKKAAAALEAGSDLRSNISS